MEARPALGSVAREAARTEARLVAAREQVAALEDEVREMGEWIETAQRELDERAVGAMRAARLRRVIYGELSVAATIGGIGTCHQFFDIGLMPVI